jgi:hypothetical protein
MKNSSNFNAHSRWTQKIVSQKNSQGFEWKEDLNRGLPSI